MSPASFQGSQEGFIKCLTQVHSQSVGRGISQMPFLGHVEDANWIQALGHFHPAGLRLWAQHPDHHLKRQLGYRCHQVIVCCAQPCTSKRILSHFQESTEVMLLIRVWMHTQAYALRVANLCGWGPVRVSAKIPQFGPTDGGLLVDKLG